MPVKSSGTLSFATDIVGEFEDTPPHKLSEFYRGGDKVPDAGINANVPTSSEIKFSDFYGATNVIEVSISSNSYIHPTTGSTVSLPMGTTLNLFNLASVFSAPVNGKIEVPFVFTIDYNSIFNNSIITGGEFGDLTIDNYGVIAGRGGHGRQNIEIGGSTAGGTKSNIGNGVTVNYGNAAIFIDYDVDLFSLINNANGFIAGGGNSTFSANTTYSDLNNRRSSVGRTAIWSARAYSGDGGGWNGGVGGNARANVSASFTDIYDPQDDNDDFSGDTTSQNNSLSRIVTSRSVNGTTGHGGSEVQSGKAWAYDPSYASTSWHPGAQSASYGSGGSGLNGGTYGGPGNIDGRHHPSRPERAAAAQSASGSGGGGGNGIGSGSGPTNVGSSGRGSAAGAGYSLQISTAATVTTSSFVNGGRRYGSSSITVSAP